MKKKDGAPAWLTRLALPHRIGKKDILLTLVPALLWYAGTNARPLWIEPRCKGPDARALCSPESVNAVDRIGLGQESGPADGFSFATQNLSGYLAIGGAVLWNAATAIGGAASPAAAAAAAGTDLVLLGQAASWNGVLNELCHRIARRPRPFVYSNPPLRGTDPSHYTSFYSGHTSFAALAGLALLLMLLARGAPGWLIALAAMSWQALTLATGYFRVMAGRHFLTDVIVGAWIGSAVAIVVFLAHKLQRRPP